MRLPVKPAETGQYVKFILACGGMVVAWAFLHDCHLAAVEPRHFTQYHRTLWPAEGHYPLLLQLAFLAGAGPGMAYGILAWLAVRQGEQPKRPLRYFAARFLLFAVVMECLLLLLGAIGAQRFAATGRTLFPGSWYPELTAGLVYTQTVNIGAYALVPPAALVLLWLLRRRRSL